MTKIYVTGDTHGLNNIKKIHDFLNTQAKEASLANDNSSLGAFDELTETSAAYGTSMTETIYRLALSDYYKGD